LPTTGGSDSSGLGSMTWLILAAGLAVTLGGAWALSRSRR
jgi:hypothetical protein